MKKIIALLLLMVSGGSFAQKKPYIVVPKQFPFQKFENQYKINGFIKHLFQEAGYETFWTDAIPMEIAQKPCETFKVEVKDASSIFTTKLFLNLLDCQGKIAYESPKAISKEKDFSKSYAEALRIAFEKIQENIEIESLLMEAVTSEEKVSDVKNENQIKTLTLKSLGADFILIDENQKPLFSLQATSINGVFNAKRNDGQQGLFIQKENELYHFEFSKEGKIIKEEYKVNEVVK